MKLIIGLGNPGEKYQKNRHNIGFRAINSLREKLKFEDWKLNKKFNVLISQGIFNGQKIILAQPQTFMNNSGRSAKSLVGYYKIPAEEIIVIHDEIDLPFGKIKVQQNRGSAGHNGVQSIIDQLGDKNFIRIRIGIKPKDIEEKNNLEKFVLENFSREEEKKIPLIIKRTVEIISTVL